MPRGRWPSETHIGSTVLGSPADQELAIREECLCQYRTEHESIFRLKIPRNLRRKWVQKGIFRVKFQEICAQNGSKRAYFHPNSKKFAPKTDQKGRPRPYRGWLGSRMLGRENTASTAAASSTYPANHQLYNLRLAIPQYMCFVGHVRVFCIARSLNPSVAHKNAPYRVYFMCTVLYTTNNKHRLFPRLH